MANNLIVARDGEEALDIVFARGSHSSRSVGDRPSVIVLDLKLPKVDGIDVLRAVKSDDRTRKIPIVVVTSSQEERDLVESYSLGANSYVVKPIDFDSFVKTITDLGFYWLAVNRPPR